MTTAPLTLDRIVATAIALADSDGLPAVSMRKVADALGSGVMSLYRHVATKDALVIAMIDAVTTDFAYPDVPELRWREKLRILARADWTMYRAHPWMIEATSKPVPSPAMSASMEWALAAIDELGLSVKGAASAVLTVSTYVLGSARIEASIPAGSDVGSAWWDAMTSLPMAALPRLDALAREVPEFDGEELMWSGLELILEGIAASAGVGVIARPSDDDDLAGT